MNIDDWLEENDLAIEKNKKEDRHPPLRNAYLKSKKNGIPFELNYGDLVIPEVCPILGIPLDHSDRDHLPSIDRIIPSKGYVKSNVHVISNRANRIKNDATVEELEKIAAYFKKLLTV